MQEITYIGPYAAVIIPSLGVAAKQGETFLVDDEVAAELLAQPGNYEAGDAGTNTGNDPEGEEE